MRSALLRWHQLCRTWVYLRMHASMQPAECARCQPRLGARAMQAAVSAVELKPGGRCDGRLRRLTQAECIALARHRRLEYIGATREASEFPGCVLWQRRRVEYNDHDDERGGCALAAKGGVCLCIPAGQF